MGSILTVQEVAEQMRCEHRTVRRAIRSGELEAALIGGKWLVREEAVEQWFRSRSATAVLGAKRVRVVRRAYSAGRAQEHQANVRGSVERLKAMEAGTDEHQKARQAL
jgi:excisionase family DNA binding protein